MKIFRWIVMIKNDPAGFYLPVTFFKFLSGVVRNGDCLEPKWSSEPVLYKLKHARFQVSELRRVGYNVYTLPYVLYAAAMWLKARKLRKW